MRKGDRMRLAPRRRRGRGDSGVTAVEFAIVIPVLLVLVIGMLEFAFVMRDYLSVGSATRTGVRVASTGAGAGPGTCPGLPIVCVPASVPALAQNAADAIQQAGSAMPQDYVDYIMVYEANANGYPAGTANDTTRLTMPSQTECASIGDCVTFRWAKSIDRYVYVSGTWDSSTIYACAPQSPSDPGPDSVGVYMHATHPYLSRLFGATLTITNRAIMQFEPLAQKVCNGNGPASGGHP